MEYDEQSIVQFPLGLFGFESETSFLLIEQPALHPIVFLQSLHTPDLCFISLPAFVVEPGYRLSLAEEDRLVLGIPVHRQPRIGQEVLCLVLIAIQPNGPTTANLMAPVVIHLGTRMAIQAITCDTPYSHRHALPLPSEALTCS